MPERTPFGRRRAKRSHVLEALPVDSWTRTQAATVFLCPSRPPHRSITRSLAPPPLSRCRRRPEEHPHHDVARRARRLRLITSGVVSHLATRDGALHGNWTRHVHDWCQRLSARSDGSEVRREGMSLAAATADARAAADDRRPQRTAGTGRTLMDRLLTVGEAASMLACSPAAIRKWMSQRRLPSVKVGRLTRIRVGDVEAFVRSGRSSEAALREQGVSRVPSRFPAPATVSLARGSRQTATNEARWRCFDRCCGNTAGDSAGNGGSWPRWASTSTRNHKARRARRPAQSGVRGVFWRANPRGVQERRRPEDGRERGEWWIRWGQRAGSSPSGGDRSEVHRRVPGVVAGQQTVLEDGP
jgi:excisionase family DNA binding protein